MTESQLLIDGQWCDGEGHFTVKDKFSGAVVAQAARAGRADCEAAVSAAERAFREDPLAPYQRYEILMKAMSLVEARRDEVAAIMVAETGFTLRDCQGDLTRALQTFQVSAEEAKRVTGEMVPLSGAPGQAGRLGFTLRVPLGVVAAITPFNSPFNTVAHKVAPAIAAGNSVVLKPATYTPVTAAKLCRILMDAGLPPGHLNLINGSGAEAGQWLLEDQRVRYYSFTGSTAVGRIIQRHAGLRRCQLELGNISGTIVMADADLEAVVPKVINASFRKAGQVCTSVQRLFVEAPVIADLAARLATRAGAIKTGDPRDPETFVGPMIDQAEAERAEAWVRQARAGGASILTGGGRDGSLLLPTVLRDVAPEMRVLCEEIFAPVISLVPFEGLDQAIEMVNATPYGLSAGIFTRDLGAALAACRRIEVGSLHVNETSSSRVDLMPYGGVKDSGFGQEGPRYAIRDMTDERLITISSS